ncbi:hypothetical protein [Geobacillus kaustophilus]|uniref:hypothetical protein n=1 Tax=Geobacillus kaustophilus TaxID=1462 RepID=UPI0011D243AA|nr:hypothetical protein [Geobacillus kaustophilus]
MLYTDPRQAITLVDAISLFRCRFGMFARLAGPMAADPLVSQRASWRDKGSQESLEDLFRWIFQAFLRLKSFS